MFGRNKTKNVQVSEDKPKEASVEKLQDVLAQHSLGKSNRAQYGLKMAELDLMMRRAENANLIVQLRKCWRIQSLVSLRIDRILDQLEGRP